MYTLGVMGYVNQKKPICHFSKTQNVTNKNIDKTMPILTAGHELYARPGSRYNLESLQIHLLRLPDFSSNVSEMQTIWVSRQPQANALSN